MSFYPQMKKSVPNTAAEIRKLVAKGLKKNQKHENEVVITWVVGIKEVIDCFGTYSANETTILDLINLAYRLIVGMILKSQLTSHIFQLLQTNILTVLSILCKVLGVNEYAETIKQRVGNNFHWVLFCFRTERKHSYFVESTWIIKILLQPYQLAILVEWYVDVSK